MLAVSLRLLYQGSIFTLKGTIYYKFFFLTLDEEYHTINISKRQTILSHIRLLWYVIKLDSLISSRIILSVLPTSTPNSQPLRPFL